MILAALVAAGLLGTSARADILLEVQESGSAAQFFTLATGSPTVPLGLSGATTVTTPDYQIQVQAGSEQQTTTQSEETSSAVKIINSDGVGGHTLTITLTTTNFTAPVTPPSISGDSHIGGTGPTLSGASTGASLAYTSSLAQATVAPSPPFPTQNIALTNSASFANDAFTTLTQLSPTGPGGTFSMIETLVVSGLNGMNDNVNYSASTTLTNVTPEPTSLMLAGLGTLGFIGYGLRRRKAMAA